jgi:competence ComEA-like helix-hairpin-helix protein
MTLYTRPQLAVLVAVVAVAGIGLAVGHWRRLHPELAERLEAFDRGSSPSDEWTRGAVPTMASPSSKLDDPAAPLDVNRASVLDLTRLPGIGPALATRIVTARERDGPFTTVEDLRRVRGLGRATLDRLRVLVTAEPAGDASTPVTVPAASVTGARTE